MRERYLGVPLEWLEIDDHGQTLDEWAERLRTSRPSDWDEPQRKGRGDNNAAAYAEPARRDQPGFTSTAVDRVKLMSDRQRRRQALYHPLDTIQGLGPDRLGVAVERLGNGAAHEVEMQVDHTN